MGQAEMALTGKGAITIWQDAPPHARADFFAWHNGEHMAERVGIAGFLRGRRFAAIDGAPEFFTLYETVDPAVHTSAAYLERLNTPTPQTRRVAPHMVNNIRSLCRVSYTSGEADGGLLVTLRYDVAPGAAGAHLALLTQTVFPQLQRQPGVEAVHLCRADEAASSVQTEEKKSRPQQALVPAWVVLVEGVADRALLESACESLLSDQTLAAAGATGIARGLYQLQYSRVAVAR
jgi:hypothetical protein